MLYKHQIRTLDATRKILKHHRRPVIVSPCGSGKTHIGTEIVGNCQKNHASTLFLAPRRELIYQTMDKFSLSGIDTGMIMAGELPKPYARHQIASFDTLHARAMRKDKIPMPTADVILVDEAHLSISRAKKEILEYYAGKIIIGLTATPCRGDGAGLGEIYDSMVNETSVRELIDGGYLVEPEYWTPSTFDLDGVQQTKSDYINSSLSRAVDKPKLIGEIYENWHRIAGDKRTIIFCTNRMHSRHVRDLFVSHGITAEHVDGETPREERADIFGRIRSGETQVLCNVHVASYGVDIPPIECAVLASPTKSLGLHIQRCGRVLRPSPGTGKTCATIIDHTGAIKRHGFLDDYIPWTLDGESDIRELKKQEAEKRGDPMEITCIKCGYSFSGFRNCPKCDFAMTPPTQDIPTKKAVLEKVNKTSPIQFFAMLVAHGLEKGYKAGWAKNQYHKKFKTWPNQTVKPIKPNAEVLGYIKSRAIAYAMGKKKYG